MLCKVVDAPMGAGKTSAAINYMNDHGDRKFLFITPYLNEVDRIVNECAERGFVAPMNRGSGKLENLERHLMDERCIASTHALFSYYTDLTSRLIQEGHYTLILDEVFTVMEEIKIKQKDLKMLLTQGFIEVNSETGRVRWTDDTYSGKFDDIKELSAAGRLILHKGAMLFWMFPTEVFDAFDNVIVLTYMYEGQIQSYYHNMGGAEIMKWYVRKNGRGKYEFTDEVQTYDYMKDVPDLIEVCDYHKLNDIGEDKHALSKSWYERAKKQGSKSESLVKLRNNLRNYLKNRCNAKESELIWTTFSEHRKDVTCKGITKGFVSCNMRATNEYRDRAVLAYCVNLHMNPVVKNYFIDNGIFADQDTYSLSMMVQWIWRSAIRDGKPIKVYIPSKRMRELFLSWLDGLKNGTNWSERQVGDVHD